MSEAIFNGVKKNDQKYRLEIYLLDYQFELTVVFSDMSNKFRNTNVFEIQTNKYKQIHNNKK